MATSTPLVRPIAVRTPPVQIPRSANAIIYWHLLSLDAPTVAMLWTWFIAKTCGIHLPLTSILAMGVAVWMLYAADRLLDSNAISLSRAIHQETPVILSAASRSASSREAASKDPDTAPIPHTAQTFPSQKQPASKPQTNPATHDLEPRHLFHRRHHRRFLTGIAVAALALTLLVPKLSTSSIRLYVILGTLLLAYFALIHLQPDAAPRLPKEIAVGIFFSAASFIPTVAHDPALRAPLLPAAILFGLTCSLNCLFIYAWEHTTPYPDAHPSTRIALRFLPQLACLAILLCAALTLVQSATPWPQPAATALAAALLLLLHHNRRHFAHTTLRAGADLCLLTPILLVFLHRP